MSCIERLRLTWALLDEAVAEYLRSQRRKHTAVALGYTEEDIERVAYLFASYGLTPDEAIEVIDAEMLRRFRDWRNG